MTKRNANKPSNFTARVEQLRAHKLAANADLGAVLGDKPGKFQFTQQTSDKLDAWGVNTDPLFTGDRNPKAIKRCIQFVNAIAEGRFLKTDRASAMIVYALHLSDGNPLNHDALHYLASNLKSDKVNTRGIPRTKLAKLFCGSVGLSTIPTQCSRTVGATGYMNLLGVTSTTGGKNAAVTLNRDHPMVKDFLALTEATSERDFEAMGEGETE